MRRRAGSGGKLHILGAGWDHLTVVGQPVGMALAILVKVPWDETNRRHDLEVRLLTDDGLPVEVQGTEVQARGPIEVGRPAGLRPGTEITLPVAMGFQGLSLDQGRFVWEFRIAGDLIARSPFQVGGGG